MDDDLQTKQQYLRSEIIDQGYDPGEFNDYMCNIRQEENIDLNDWSLQDLKNVVQSFKESLANRENEEENNDQREEYEQREENEQIVQENQQPYNEDNNLNNNNTPQNQNINTNKNAMIDTANTIKSIETQLNQKGNNAFDEYKKIVPCTKLENNELTYREDLYITISEPVKVNPGFFSFSYYQYTVRTNPVRFNVLRKVSDFIFLSQKLPLIHPVIYTPSLPHFAYGLKDDSPKKMRYIQNYMNLLIENKYFRTLPIVYDFLTLPQPDWNNKVKTKYSKIKEATGFDTMPNFEGKYILKITKEDEMKASKIKTEINSKNEVLVNLNNNLDELLATMDKMSTCFKNVGQSFAALQKRYPKNDILNKGYENLSNLFQTWSSDYLIQKDFIKDEIKYYFKFLNKEYTTFLKNYENYRMARDEYKKTFEKMKKNKNPTNDDLFLLKDIKKYYAFELIHVNDEYIKLEERHGKRLIKQFVKYYEKKDVIFQDYQKCCHLLQFQEYYIMNDKRYKLENYINEYEEEENKNKNNNIEQENNNDNNNIITEQKDNNNNNNNIEENNKEENLEDNSNKPEEENLKEKNNENNKEESSKENNNTINEEDNKEAPPLINKEENTNENNEKEENKENVEKKEKENDDNHNINQIEDIKEKNEIMEKKEINEENKTQNIINNDINTNNKTEEEKNKMPENEEKKIEIKDKEQTNENNKIKENNENKEKENDIDKDKNEIKEKEQKEQKEEIPKKEEITKKEENEKKEEITEKEGNINEKEEKKIEETTTGGEKEKENLTKGE